jgi:uncharacterized protein (UPF0332 family)
MKRDEFLDTADRLSRGTTEGDWRSAVSRAYYAVFHFFREFLAAHGVYVSQGGAVHFNLYSGLNNCGVAAVALIAGRLNDLRDWRAKADYDLVRRFQPGPCMLTVQEARAMVADFQALLTGLPPAQVAAGVRRYFQTIGRLPPTP